MIRPDGVVSKKLIGDRKTESKMASCMLPAARVMRTAANQAYTLTKTAANNAALLWMPANLQRLARYDHEQVKYPFISFRG